MIKKHVDKLYNQFFSEKNYEVKSQILCTIIDIKCSSNIQDYTHSLYLDVKKFIYFYLKSKEVKDYGYDEYNSKKIEEKILCLPLLKRRRILQYTKTLLKKNYEEIYWVEDAINIVNIELHKKNNNIFRWFIYYSTYNTPRMCTSIVILLLLTCVFLLPAFIPCFELFIIEYIDISSNFYVNHFFNVFSLFFCLDLGAKIICLNYFALLLYSLIKLIYIVVIVNFIYRKLATKIYIDEEHS